MASVGPFSAYALQAALIALRKLNDASLMVIGAPPPLTCITKSVRNLSFFS